MLTIGLKGLDKAAREIQKWADKKLKEIHYAMAISLFVEAKRSKEKLQMDLKTGKLGLKSKSKYRNEAADKRYKRSRKDRYPPLASTGMLRGITSHTDKRKLSLTLGFEGFTPGTQWQAKIAEKSMYGYTWPITERHKEVLHKYGIHLRKMTTSIQVPARDIVGTFFKKEGHIMLANIKRNFDRKMSGERI